jgi:hypothetical protein
MNWLIGHTGHSFLDYWTLAHLAFWFVVGSTCAAVKVKQGFALLAGLSGAISWEIFEQFASRAWPTVWLSPESWWNSWVSDPLTCVVAMAVAYFGFAKWRP